LRIVALVAVAVGTAGSLAFTLRAGVNTPRLLLIGFVVWILSPFAALAWAHLVSRRWSVLTRTALYGVTLMITLVSLAFYGEVFQPPAGSAPAFVFVAVPPASWFLLAIVVPIAAWITRRRSQGSRTPP
jgi:hypothetical protein